MSTNFQLQADTAITLGDGTLELVIPFSITTPLGLVTNQALTTGANTITLPAGTVSMVCIVPPAANTSAITAKGVSGDTGITLHKTLPTFLALDTTVTTFVLTVGGNMTVTFTWL